MSMQLNFSFPTNIDIYDTRNFIVHDGNRDIFDFITSSLLIDEGTYFLTGPKSSGKTYICNIWNRLKGASFIELNIFNKNHGSFIDIIENKIKENGKYILENIEQANLNEEYLLYLINIITEKKATLLITSTKYIHNFGFTIPDLNSRLNNVFNFVMNDLNDESKQKIIIKLLSDKQMNIDSNILLYISKKISGNYDEILNFIKKLEEKLQSNKIKRITINMAKELL